MDSNARNAAILTRAAELAVAANSLRDPFGILAPMFADFTPTTYLELATSEIDALLSTPTPDEYTETDSMRTIVPTTDDVQAEYNKGTESDWDTIYDRYYRSKRRFLGAFGSIPVYRTAEAAEERLETGDKMVGMWCHGCQSIHVLTKEA